MPQPNRAGSPELGRTEDIICYDIGGSRKEHFHRRENVRPIDRDRLVDGCPIQCNGYAHDSQRP
jgi:hypothetical protein